MANNQGIRKQKTGEGNRSSCLLGEWFVQPPNQRFIKINPRNITAPKKAR